MNERLMARDRLIAQASDSAVEAYWSLVQIRQKTDNPELDFAISLLDQAMQLITEAYE